MKEAKPRRGPATCAPEEGGLTQDGNETVQTLPASGATASSRGRGTAAGRPWTRGAPPALRAPAAVAATRALRPIGWAGADKERSASAGFSRGRDVGASSLGAPAPSRPETRPRRSLLHPARLGGRGGLSCWRGRVLRPAPASFAAAGLAPRRGRPPGLSSGAGDSRGLASRSGPRALPLPRPLPRRPSLPAHSPRRGRAPGAPAKPAGSPPPPRPLPRPLRPPPGEGSRRARRPPEAQSCRAPMSRRSPQPGRHTRSNFRAQPRERGRLNRRVPARKILAAPASPPAPLGSGRAWGRFCPFGFPSFSGDTESGPRGPRRAPASRPAPRVPAVVARLHGDSHLRSDRPLPAPGVSQVCFGCQ